MTIVKTIKEIKELVSKGIKVYSDSDNYIVIKDSIGQYLIHSQSNDYYTGLHGLEGTKYENKINGTKFYYYN